MMSVGKSNVITSHMHWRFRPPKKCKIGDGNPSREDCWHCWWLSKLTIVFGTSLFSLTGIMVNNRNHPQMALIQVSKIINYPGDISRTVSLSMFEDLTWVSCWCWKRDKLSGDQFYPTVSPQSEPQVMGKINKNHAIYIYIVISHFIDLELYGCKSK